MHRCSCSRPAHPHAIRPFTASLTSNTRLNRTKRPYKLHHANCSRICASSNYGSNIIVAHNETLSATHTAGRSRLSSLQDRSNSIMKATGTTYTSISHEQYPVHIQTDSEAQAALPSASLTRVMYSTVQPARFARNAVASTTSSSGGRSGPLSSISSLMIIALAVTTTTAAAVRARLRSVRECQSCRGYGVERCKLCIGKGTIEWEGKMAHKEPCPMCLGRRLNRCSCCGGGLFFTRTVFRHKAIRSEADLVERLQQLAVSTTKPTKGWNNPFRRNARQNTSQDDKIEESDKYAQEVMLSMID